MRQAYERRGGNTLQLRQLRVVLLWNLPIRNPYKNSFSSLLHLVSFLSIFQKLFWTANRMLGIWYKAFKQISKENAIFSLVNLLTSIFSNQIIIKIYHYFEPVEKKFNAFVAACCIVLFFGPLLEMVFSVCSHSFLWESYK